MAGKLIKDADRCQVGKHKNGTYHVWHKVMGEGTAPHRNLTAEQAIKKIDELLHEFENNKGNQ